MKQKLFATAMVASMALSMVGCGSSDSASSNGDGTTLTIFNSKVEVQDAFEEMAQQYSEATGVNVEVYYSSDTVAAHMATKYSSGDPYTLSMVDPKDIYSLANEHGIDMTGEKWAENTEYEIEVDGKVLGFPLCVEARGLMYNATAIENITGKEFNPDDYKTLDAFKGLLEELVKGGMEAPVGIMKEDWSLGAHLFQEIYEEQPDVDAFVASLYEGTADLANNAKYNSIIDTFDVLKKYNYAAGSPIAAEREVSEQKLAEGEIAFMFGGNWDWSMIKDFEYSEKMGMMALPQNTDDGSNEKLVGGGSKYFFIDNSENTTDEQRQAAKDFLNWLVFDEAGNTFLTADCAFVPAYNNIDASALDPLSISVKKYADLGAMIPNYNYDPDDHFSIVGASMQKYLAGQIDRAQFATEVENYWKSATPVQK